MISFIVPVRGNSGYFREAMDSIFAQTITDWEAVVCEGLSEDDTAQVADEYAFRDSRIRVFHITEDGMYAAFSRCVHEARGEYGAFVHADDWIQPDYAENMLSLTRDDVGFVFCPSRVGSDWQHSTLYHDMFPQTGIYDSKIALDSWAEDRIVFPVSPGCAIFRVKDMDVFDLNIADVRQHPQCGLDLYLYLTVASKYPKMGFYKKPMAFFRKWDGSTSTRQKMECRLKWQKVMRYFFGGKK